MNNQYPDAIPGEVRHVEFDSEHEFWSIFGEKSGHCYGQYMSEEEANDNLKKYEELISNIEN